MLPHDHKHIAHGSGNIYYTLNNYYHRLDGPAIIIYKYYDGLLSTPLHLIEKHHIDTTQVSPQNPITLYCVHGQFIGTTQQELDRYIKLIPFM